MRTGKNSTRNTSTRNAQDNQQKSFSNNLVILTGNLGADASFFGANDSAASFRMATKSKFGEKNSRTETAGETCHKENMRNASRQKIGLWRITALVKVMCGEQVTANQKNRPGSGLTTGILHTGLHH